MKRIHGICSGLLGLLASTTSLHAADCEALKQLSLPDTTITLATQVTSGDLTGPGIDKPLHDLPPFCRVTGILHPTADSSDPFRSLAA